MSMFIYQNNELLSKYRTHSNLSTSASKKNVDFWLDKINLVDRKTLVHSAILLILVVDFLFHVSIWQQRGGGAGVGRAGLLLHPEVFQADGPRAQPQGRPLLSSG